VSDSRPGRLSKIETSATSLSVRYLTMNERQNGRGRPVATQTADAAVSSALNQAWDRIRAEHPAVPEAVVTITSGRESTCSAVAWAASEHVIEASPGVLQRGPENVVAWLLHLAVHGSLGPPTSASEGRYHSQDFRDMARKFGFIVPEQPTGGSGWNDTAMPDKTARAYRAEIESIRRALKRWEPPAPLRSARPDAIAWCACPSPRRLRMANTVYSAGPVICGVCQQPFSIGLKLRQL
jgi:hypothetical protein